MNQTQEAFEASICDVNRAVEHAKKILLANKCQQFTSADIAAVAKLIIDREQSLSGMEAGCYYVKE